MRDEDRLEQFIDRYSPQVASAARDALQLLTDRLPTATRLVYDNYNALAVAFAPAQRASDAVLSLTLYPKYVSLFFTKGAALPDPHKILEGTGSSIRHIKLNPISKLKDPAVVELLEAAISAATCPFPDRGGGQTIVKSVSERQRPRR